MATSSASVTVARPFNSLGRSIGVALLLDQNPCRSGCPSRDRGGVHACLTALLFVIAACGTTCPCAMETRVVRPAAKQRIRCFIFQTYAPEARWSMGNVVARAAPADSAAYIESAATRSILRDAASATRSGRPCRAGRSWPASIAMPRGVSPNSLRRDVSPPAVTVRPRYLHSGISFRRAAESKVERSDLGSAFKIESPAHFRFQYGLYWLSKKPNNVELHSAIQLWWIPPRGTNESNKEDFDHRGNRLDGHDRRSHRATRSKPES